MWTLQFEKFESFKSHFSHKHKEDPVGNIDNWEGFGQGLQNENAVTGKNEDGPEFENGQIEETIESMTRFIVLFILKTKEQINLANKFQP